MSTSIAETIDQYIHVDGRMSLTRIVMEYFSFIDMLWSEQDLSAKDRNVSELLLARLTVNNHDVWQVQPWFVGQGSVWIDFLVKSFFAPENIVRNPFAAELRVPAPYDGMIYILDDPVHINLTTWAAAVSGDPITVKTTTYYALERYPQGLGIFPVRDPTQTHDATNTGNSYLLSCVERRRVRISLNEKSSLSQLSAVDQMFLRNEVREYWNEIRAKYLPFIQDHCDLNFHTLTIP